MINPFYGRKTANQVKLFLQGVARFFCKSMGFSCIIAFRQVLESVTDWSNERSRLCVFQCWLRSVSLPLLVLNSPQLRTPPLPIPSNARALPRPISSCELDKFIERTGLSPVTIWRFRKKKFLETVNICGRHYVLRSEIARFNSRAFAGEFSKPCTRPTTASAEDW